MISLALWERVGVRVLQIMKTSRFVRRILTMALVLFAGKRTTKTMKKLIIIFGSICVVLLAIFTWWQISLSPINSKDKTPQVFVVAPGSGLHQVADNLSSQGLIKNSFVFLVYMRLTGQDSKIQKGDFKFTPSMSSQQIAKELTQGTLDVWVTIIPGKRADEIADILKNNITTYHDDWRAQLRVHEGYLFPDTYLIPRDASIDQIITILLNNFNAKYQTALSMQTNTLTQEQAVIVASMLQREAPGGDDMQKVASVLENRLNIGMALQIDATVQYALGYNTSEHTWWKKNLTAEDLHIDSAYNTYAQPGLPPTPIASPGLEALEAALNPADTNYLYYFTDGKGVTHFSRTLDEHNTSIRKYGL